MKSSPVRQNLGILPIWVLITVFFSLLGTGCSGETESRPLPELPPVVSGLPAAGVVRPFREFTIAWTAEVRGEIEPCGCPTVPYGGLARRSRALQQLRGASDTLFVVDAGEMLTKGQYARDVARAEARARLILGSVVTMGLDAWSPSPVDLRPGGLALLKGSPALSANWIDGDNRPVLPGALIVERNGVRLGIVGLGDTDKDQKGTDRVEAVRRAMEGKTADAWVVLTNTDALEVAEKVPGLGAVLSVRGEQMDPPRKTSGAPIIEAPDRGRYLSVLHVYLSSENGPWTVMETDVWARMATAERLLVGLSGETAEAQRQRIRALKAELETANAGRNVVVVEQRPLGSELDGPSDLDARLRDFDSETRRLAAQRAASVPTESGYQSASACVSCHRDRFAAWSYDPHAKAYDALLERKAGMDPECVACHSTGYGEPGGFGELSEEKLDHFKAVQCEACHGPKGGHPQDGHDLREVNATTCLGCHDPANSPNFNFENYWKRISCVELSKNK